MEFSHKWTQLSTLCICSGFKFVPTLQRVHTIITAIAECARNGEEVLYQKVIDRLLLPALDDLSGDDMIRFLSVTKPCVKNLPIEITQYIN